MTVSRSRSRLVALATVAMAATTLASAPAEASTPSAPPGAARAAARAETAAAPFVLWAPRKVTAYSYDHETYTDFGLRAVAGSSPVELWSTRPSYGEQIRTVWRSPAGEVALPTGSMRNFSGLAKFLSLRIKPRHGKAMTLTRSACLSGWSERVRPDAPATSPYPTGCYANPFSLGSVQGLEAGWASMLLADGGPLRLEAGHYRVRARIAPAYAAAFGLTPAQATRTLTLVVRAEESEEEEVGPTTAHVHEGMASGRAEPAAERPAGPRGRVVGPVPDLRSLPAWGISLSRNSHYLRFAATVWNAGDSPLVVDGFRRGNQDLMDAYQYFFDAEGNQTGYQPVGHLHWDAKPSHQHWHFEDFARYSLLRKDKSEAAVSKKEAFCLANTDAVDLTVPDAAWKPENTDLATSCGDQTSLSIREVLASGWGDTYLQMRAGQSFRIDNLPNGVYYIAVAANPGGNLVEASTANNLALRRIRLGGSRDDRTVTVPKIGVIEEDRYGGTG